MPKQQLNYTSDWVILWLPRCQSGSCAQYHVGGHYRNHLAAEGHLESRVSSGASGHNIDISVMSVGIFQHIVSPVNEELGDPSEYVVLM